MGSAAARPSRSSCPSERRMANFSDAETPRLLVIDDNLAIHQDFLKILGTTPEKAAEDELLAAEAALFGEPAARTYERPVFQIDSAYQGQEGVEKVRRALEEGRPYGMAFVDMRMPPAGAELQPSNHSGPSNPPCRWASVPAT